MLQSKGIALVSAINTDIDSIMESDLKHDIESVIQQLANSDRVRLLWGTLARAYDSLYFSTGSCLHNWFGLYC